MYYAINLEMALKTAKYVTEKAGKEDPPIAVAIMNPNLQVIVILSMDGVMPISSELIVKKAYTALKTNSDTMYWQTESVDPANFADPNITCFGGGVQICDINNKVLGAVAVSGRKSQQDHELAFYGVDYLISLLRGTKE